MPPRHRPRTSEGRSGQRSDAKPAPCRIPVAGQYHQGGAKRGNDRPTRRDSPSVRPPSSSATIGRRPPVRPPSAPRRRAGRTRQCTLATTRTEPRSISATLYRGGPSTAYESPGDPGSRGDRPESTDGAPLVERAVAAGRRRRIRRDAARQVRVRRHPYALGQSGYAPPEIQRALRDAIPPGITIATATLGFGGARVIDHIALPGSRGTRNLLAAAHQPAWRCRGGRHGSAAIPADDAQAATIDPHELNVLEGPRTGVLLNADPGSLCVPIHTVQSRTPFSPAIQRAMRLPQSESWRRRKPQLSSTEPPAT